MAFHLSPAGIRRFDARVASICFTTGMSHRYLWLPRRCFLICARKRLLRQLPRRQNSFAATPPPSKRPKDVCSVSREWLAKLWPPESQSQWSAAKPATRPATRGCGPIRRSDTFAGPDFFNTLFAGRTGHRHVGTEDNREFVWHHYASEHQHAEITHIPAARRRRRRCRHQLAFDHVNARPRLRPRSFAAPRPRRWLSTRR